MCEREGERIAFPIRIDRELKNCKDEKTILKLV